MEGLEISEVNYKALFIEEDNTFRFDAEHYKKIYNVIFGTLRRYPCRKISELTVKPVMTGHTPSMKQPEFYGGSIKFIKTDNLRENNITNIFSDYLTEKGNLKIAQTYLKKNDIITTIIGATNEIIGRTTIIQESDLPANINQNIALISIDKEKVNPIFINIYLNSFYGKNSFYYHSRQTEQVNLNCREVERILVPILKRVEQKVIVLYNEAIQKQRKSREFYSQAEKLLLEELGLKDWQPSQEQTNIKTFKESFLSTGRLDAEYYQPKYEELIQHLARFEIKSLGSIVYITKSIEPGSEAYRESGIPFVRVSNISKYGITKTDIHLDRNEYQSYELRPRKDTILLSKDGSVGIAYKVEKDLDIITSGALLHLNVIDNEFLPDYLTLVLNSIVVKLQSERDAGGSIIQHWKPSEIEQVVIPKLPKPIQQQITDNIQESFKLKRQSEQLLEIAKRAVEIAIEQNEEVAMEYIKENSL